MYYIGENNLVYARPDNKDSIKIKFVCDELIANIISILNLKGYITCKSSQGHYYDHSEGDVKTYISFDSSIKINEIGLPKYFSYDANTNSIYYIYNIDKWGLTEYDDNDAFMTFVDIQLFIIEILYKWAYNLPQL